jgi:glycosyltransferase involved in cell wall biosynthesis
MAPRLIDIVGHFGTTFSYPTVASRVARALRECGLLGTVSNLDPAWHPAHEDLKPGGFGGVDASPRGSHVFLVAAPHHYMDAYPQLYGRARSAIFASPNTDQLSDEHSGTIEKFGRVVCPSHYCAGTVADAVADSYVDVLPLGADEKLLEGRERRLGSVAAGGPHGCSVVHFSTDQWWPGRKGTQELLKAWKRLEGLNIHSRASLTLHVPPALEVDASYLVRDMDLVENVSVVSGDLKGSQDLSAVFDQADLVVAPSRCEGFGIMFLSSLVAGVPLLCTVHTGHTDFLTDFSGWLGVPGSREEPLAGEVGYAPSVDPVVLEQSLRAAIDAAPSMALALWQQEEVARDWTWPSVLEQWTTYFQDWLEDEDE